MCLPTCINADFLSNASWEPNPGGWIEQAVSIVGKRFLKPIIRQNLVNWTSSPSWSYPAEHISSSHTVSSRDRISRVRIGPLGAGFPPQHLRLVFVLGDWLWKTYIISCPLPVLDWHAALLLKPMITGSVPCSWRTFGWIRYTQGGIGDVAV